jgi:hypothetical protein
MLLVVQVDKTLVKIRVPSTASENQTGLPDLVPKIPIWVNLRWPRRTKNIDMFYGTLEYFMAIWYFLWSFGIFCGHLVYIFLVLVCFTKKNHLAALESSGRPEDEKSDGIFILDFFAQAADDELS